MDGCPLHTMCVAAILLLCGVGAVSCDWPRRLHYFFCKINKALTAFHPICYHLHRGCISFFLLPAAAAATATAIDESFVRHFHRCINFISFYVFSFSLSLPLCPHCPTSIPSAVVSFLFFFSINRSKQIADLTFGCFIGFMRPYCTLLSSMSVMSSHSVHRTPYCVVCHAIGNVSINIKCQSPINLWNHLLKSILRGHCM